MLITGGSSGIGLALAFRYAESCDNLILVSGSLKKLEDAGSRLSAAFPLCNVHLFAADVANESEVAGVAEKVSRTANRLDILICNAGVMRCGRFEDNPPAETRRAFDINYWGMHYTAFHFMPLLKASGAGQVAFVSSVAGYTGLFGYTQYAPSKFAVAGLAECLRMEFKDYQISVSVIYPPDTETPMLEFERENTLPECRALSKGASTLKVEKVASGIVRDLEKRKFEIYFNLESRLIRILKGIIPSFYYWIVDRIVRSSRRN